MSLRARTQGFGSGSLYNASVPEDSPALCIGGSKEILKSHSISKIRWIVCWWFKGERLKAGQKKRPHVVER